MEIIYRPIMKCYALRPKQRLFAVDNLFLAKAPLIPNRYLWDKKGYQMALFESDDESLILCSDHEGFIKQYQSYYQERFDMEELAGPPMDRGPVYGKLAPQDQE